MLVYKNLNFSDVKSDNILITADGDIKLSCVELCLGNCPAVDIVTQSIPIVENAEHRIGKEMLVVCSEKDLPEAFKKLSHCGTLQEADQNFAQIMVCLLYRCVLIY